MKNRKSLTLIILTLFVGFTSCKKNDPASDGTVITPVQTCLISKLSTPADTSYTTFEYDSQNRVIKADNFYKGKIAESNTYAYSGNTITVTRREKNILKEITIFQLNNGLTTASNSEQLDTVRVTTWDNIKNEPKTDLYVRNTAIVKAYQRNSEGFLTRLVTTTNTSSSEPGFKTASTSDTITYNYSNGNLTQEVKSSSSLVTSQMFEYYTDQANLQPSNNNFVNKPSKNILKKINFSIITHGTPGGIISLSYTYSYNAAGLIIKQDATYQGKTDSHDYEYSCR